MPVETTEVKIYLSGGAGNTNPFLSLGGAISTTELTDNTLHNLFPEVTSAESSAGANKYLLVYIKNTDAALSMTATKVFISQNSTSAQEEYDIGLAAAGLNATEAAIANINTAPATVTFSHPTTDGTGLSMGTIPAGQYYGLWVKEIIPAGTTAKNDNTAILSISYDTSE